jgi:methanethiol S-methyltransferase
MTVIMTAVVVLLWQPIPIRIWQVRSEFAAGMIYAAYLGVWAMMSAATFHFGHLVFAAATFAYIFLATPFEEADLIDELGDTYRDDRGRVPAFIPALIPALRRKSVRSTGGAD